MDTINPFSVIALRELPTWVKVYKNDGVTNAKEIMNELALIDDLLIISKTHSLLNRKRGLKTMLEARISKELNHKTINLNTKGK
jgi:hypothetical protein